MKSGSPQSILFRLLLMSLLFIGSHNASSAELYFIDAHSQIDHEVDDLDLIITRMDESGVGRTILAARSKRTQKEVIEFAERHPDRIVPAIRLKGAAYRDNSPKYYKKLHKRLNSGRFGAMAEILLYHAQKGDKAPEVIVYPDDERVQAALDGAMAAGWPFVMHIEFKSLDDADRRQFMEGMERLLAQHPQQPFILNHMGQLDAGDVLGLIERHSNIHFTTAHTNPVLTRYSSQPWVDLLDGNTLITEWKALFIKHPDRFVFALDNVWSKHWKTYYPEQMQSWRQALSELPPPVAHAVAHGNAERLWRLAPK